MRRVRWVKFLIFLVLLAGAVPGGDRKVHVYDRPTGQSLTLYRPPAGSAAAPVLVFIHGGGWSAGARRMGEGAQPAHFAARGMAWATVSYRLVPKVTVEQQLGDIARALGWIARKGPRLGLDPERIVLVGHSSGAHLAAMLAADPRWLAEAGLRFESLRGVITLDGAGLDLALLRQAGAAASSFYAGAFGPDAARWEALSPTSHAKAPNAPRWLMLFDSTHNPAGGIAARRLAAGLIEAGDRAEVEGIAATTHMGMLRNLGRAVDPVTARVDAFLDFLP